MSNRVPQTEVIVDCAVEGCERPRRKLQFCQSHYQRFRRYGDICNLPGRSA